MEYQIDRETFAKALKELGHDPVEYAGKKLSLSGVASIYELSQEEVLKAVETKKLCAHYDYQKDIIWMDALEVAHYYYCLRSQQSLFKKY